MTVEPTRSNRRSAGVVLHRTRGLRDAVRNVDGVPVTCVERTLVDTWGRPGDLALPAVRAAVITAVRRRMCRPRDLAIELDRRPQLRARASLVELVRLLAEGCQSELEIWGCLNVLQAPGMPRFPLQHHVMVTGRTFFLDAAREEVHSRSRWTAPPGTGRATSGNATSAAMHCCTVGWQTLRFSFARLTGTGRLPGDIRAVHAARLRLLRPAESSLRPLAPDRAWVRSAPRRGLRARRWAAPASRSRPASATRP